MDDKGLIDEIASAATAFAESHDPELYAAAATIAENEPPPTGPLSQLRAAAALGLSRRRLRDMLAAGKLHPAGDGRLYVSDLQEQLAILKAARKTRR